MTRLNDLLERERKDIEQAPRYGKHVIIFAKGFERAHERLTPGKLFRTPTMNDARQETHAIHDILYHKTPTYIAGQAAAHGLQALSFLAAAYVAAQYVLQ